MGHRAARSRSGVSRRFGCIIPTAIATGAGAQYLFQDLSQRGAIRSLYDFENRKPFFEGVDSRYKFCLLSAVGQDLRGPEAKLAFFLSDVSDLDDAHRTFTLSPDDIKLLNPNTGTLPIFRARRDADLTVKIYRHIPVLCDESDSARNSWNMAFKATMFHMTDDSHLFRTRETLESDGWKLTGNIFERDGAHMLPLYEAKMARHFDHRWNSFFDAGNEDRRKIESEEKTDAGVVALPRYWVAEADIPGTNKHGEDIMESGVTSRLVAALSAVQDSFVFDYVSRQKISGAHMALMTWKQLPVPKPDELERHVPFLLPRVLELVYTSHDMTPLADDLGDEKKAPFIFDEERRAVMRAELDAYMFHLYGIGRENVDYIMETFQTESGGLKNNDIARFGSYRTKEMILSIYDRMAETGMDLVTPLSDGETFVSELDPPPGHGPRHPAA